MSEVGNILSLLWCILYSVILHIVMIYFWLFVLVVLFLFGFVFYVPADIVIFYNQMNKVFCKYTTSVTIENILCKVTHLFSVPAWKQGIPLHKDNPSI